MTSAAHAETSYGTGLQGMADRLAALGGELRVTSAPGEGTIVEGSVPINELAAMAPPEAGLPQS